MTILLSFSHIAEMKDFDPMSHLAQSMAFSAWVQNALTSYILSSIFTDGWYQISFPQLPQHLPCGVEMHLQVYILSFIFTDNESSWSVPGGEFRSPNYPGIYPAGLRCTYKFQGQKGQRIKIEFQDFDLFGDGTRNSEPSQ